MDDDNPLHIKASTIPYNHQAEGVEQPLLKLHGIAMGYGQPKIVNGIPQKGYMIHSNWAWLILEIPATDMTFSLGVANPINVANGKR